MNRRNMLVWIRVSYTAINRCPRLLNRVLSIIPRKSKWLVARFDQYTKKVSGS